MHLPWVSRLLNGLGHEVSAGASGCLAGWLEFGATTSPRILDCTSRWELGIGSPPHSEKRVPRELGGNRFRPSRVRKGHHGACEP